MPALQNILIMFDTDSLCSLFSFLMEIGSTHQLLTRVSQQMGFTNLNTAQHTLIIKLYDVPPNILTDGLTPIFLVLDKNLPALVLYPINL